MSINIIKKNNIDINLIKKCILPNDIVILDNIKLIHYCNNLTIDISYYGMYYRYKYIDNTNLAIFTYNIIKFINYNNIWINLINFIINYIILYLITNKNKYKWNNIIIKLLFYINIPYNNYFYYFYMEVTININIKMYNKYNYLGFI